MGEINDDPLGNCQTREAPHLALSVRQPWAWAIFNGKDIENRSAAAVNHGMTCRRIAIHAAKGMTRAEYDSALDFIVDAFCEMGVSTEVPRPEALTRGALIGSVEVVSIVKQSESPWFMGPRGLVLANPCLWSHPIPCVGALGYFDIGRMDKGEHVEAPKPWMIAWPTGHARAAAAPKPLPLFFGDAA